MIGRPFDPPAFFAMQPGANRLTHRWLTGRGPLPGEVNAPASIVIDARGRWYVAELYGHRVQVFQASGLEP